MGQLNSSCGPKESMLHLLQFAEMAIAVLAALFLEIIAKEPLTPPSENGP
jgi:hypothetical protein